jgi:hypothetical protein
MPVPCEVTVTLAPEITAPALSLIVPEKLPVAWAFSKDVARDRKKQQHRVRSASLFIRASLVAAHPR